MAPKRSLFAACAALLVAAAAWPALAGDYDVGLAAFQNRDYKTAIAVWTPLAEAGDVAAQFNLGRMYDEGVGVAENGTKAFAWYRKAATAGFTPAVLQLGLSYLAGDGCQKDVKRGLHMIRQAADTGDPEAEFQLGKVYRDGQVVKRNDRLAMKWYMAAAAQGHPRAEYRVGFMYGSGFGVQQNFVMAYYYYTLAGKVMPISLKERDHLAEFMTPDQLAKATAMLDQKQLMASSGQAIGQVSP